jgi:lysophospholipase L1-like esterase
VVQKSENQTLGTAQKNDTVRSEIEIKKDKDFNLYLSPGLITKFDKDSNQSAMPGLMKKLHQLRTTGKGKIRIAYFGDSMIEEDLITQTLRSLLQSAFGGQGVGYLPIKTPFESNRETIDKKAVGTWQDKHLKNDKQSIKYLSGHVFFGDLEDNCSFTDKTIQPNTIGIDKSLLFGKTDSNTVVSINNQKTTLYGKSDFNKIILDKSTSNQLVITGTNQATPIYGVTFESEHGVIVDNYSFRGISGTELGKLDSMMLQAVAAQNPYDLIIFQYGINLLFRPEDQNFNYYAKQFEPVAKKFKNIFKDAELLIIGSTDRAFRIKGIVETAPGLDDLIKIQAAMAYSTGAAFYNQFATMGGKNTIVRWAESKPALANKDYIHPNRTGAATLANFLYQALWKDYQKFIKSLQPKN